MGAPLSIPNVMARRLWLDSNLLLAPPTGSLDLPDMIARLGFVQLDTVQVVARAHHHILWSRNQSYRETMFDPLLARDRAVFEHFTHDASVLPMQFLPYWQRQFRRKAEQMGKAGWWKGLPDEAARAEIKARIAREGALSTHAFQSGPKSKDHAWAKKPHKMALDYMWYAGELATCYRQNFTKFYNLPERVFPDTLRSQKVSDPDQINWLCQAALRRLSFATLAEVQRFWDAMSMAECRNWAADADLIEVEVETANGSRYSAVASADLEDRMAELADRPAPGQRMRILNPFDPAIRDRDRLERLFGMQYRVEMFVPAAKRQYGYYVYPLLEGTRFVGRVEVSADRKAGVLRLGQLWLEKGQRWGAGRQARLQAELRRFARLADCVYAPAGSELLS
ncbi:winged helix-turn-helix domain-containing protein [Thalassobius sp. Cn5-15]|uniref:winged helix-turn-helix domain-containing protein n=1 Tax=Thalassobius sp. Cn5-15 TaxID=2917763 RepID=UPI001EF20295|nr:crosslink repair DNA glycosylase YcaQ family protein [Thalassobius sp. Cn5-15]MCG7492054.1 winged helix DNA-binding domain-containing protein [Thalassobius sp. Cn5-15]